MDCHPEYVRERPQRRPRQDGRAGAHRVQAHSELGNAPAYKLFDSVAVQRKPDVGAARSYRDYTVTVADTLPEGVTCERLS